MQTQIDKRPIIY